MTKISTLSKGFNRILAFYRPYILTVPLGLTGPVTIPQLNEPGGVAQTQQLKSKSYELVLVYKNSQTLVVKPLGQHSWWTGIVDIFTKPINRIISNIV